ncbi:MAG: methyltransferase domain-containing protein [Acidimicrobiia bacterium]
MTTLVDAHGEHPLDGDALAERVSTASRVIIDVGAGDGRYAFTLAQDHPQALVIAFDPAADNLRETATRAARKKNGAPNLVLLRASVETPPAALESRGSEVHVILPWGRLFEGLIEPDPRVLHGLAACTKPDGMLWIVLNAGAWDSVPQRLAGLPRPSVDVVEARMIPALRTTGFEPQEVRALSDAECRAINSGWARRLAHRGRVPEFVAVRAIRRTA